MPTWPPGRGAAARLDLRQLEYCVGFIYVCELRDGFGEYYANYAVTWDSPSTQILIEVAGHLSQTTDGGEGLAYRFSGGSANISGGPYHFKLLTFDGASLGSQDNQISGSVIQPSPAECVVVSGVTNVWPGPERDFRWHHSPRGAGAICLYVDVAGE